jgi:hypothetical protein
MRACRGKDAGEVVVHGSDLAHSAVIDWQRCTLAVEAVGWRIGGCGGNAWGQPGKCAKNGRTPPPFQPRQQASPLEFLSQLVPNRRELLAVAAPRSVELDEGALAGDALCVRACVRVFTAVWVQANKK